MTAAVCQMTDTEKDFVAVERCRELEQETPTEKEVVPCIVMAPQQRYSRPATVVSDLAPDDWPTVGQITFEGVNLVYPKLGARVLETTPMKFALESRSLAIAWGQRIGIVGRTGSGKSSILNVLFRLVPHMPGPVSHVLVAKNTRFHGASGIVSFM